MVSVSSLKGRALGWVPAALVILAATPVTEVLAKECGQTYYGEATAKIQMAYATGILSNGPKGARLVALVEDDVWFGMRDTSRLNMIDMLHCAIAGPGRHLSQLDLLGKDSARLLARITNGTVEIVEP